jgi:hypothetical protein
MGYFPYNPFPWQYSVPMAIFRSHGNIPFPWQHSVPMAKPWAIFRIIRSHGNIPFPWQYSVPMAIFRSHGKAMGYFP